MQLVNYKLITIGIVFSVSCVQTNGGFCLLFYCRNTNVREEDKASGETGVRPKRNF